jgi:uncharacterized protein YwgA
MLALNFPKLSRKLEGIMKEKERVFFLGLILRRIARFDIGTFEGRLVLQKTVYLLQSLGFYLGYKFSWYIHGPYSPDLTKDAFKLKPIYKKIPRVKFVDREIEANLAVFKKFVGTKKDDANWLEQLACTHFLKALFPKADKQTIVNRVLSHESHFTKEQCLQAWNYLVKEGLIAE